MESLVVMAIIYMHVLSYRNSILSDVRYKGNAKKNKIIVSR